MGGKGGGRVGVGAKQRCPDVQKVSRANKQRCPTLFCVQLEDIYTVDLYCRLAPARALRGRHYGIENSCLSERKCVCCCCLPFTPHINWGLTPIANRHNRSVMLGTALTAGYKFTNPRVVTRSITVHAICPKIDTVIDIKSLYSLACPNRYSATPP